MDPGTRVDVEPGVPPALHHSDEVTVDLAPGQEHPQHLVPEKRLQILEKEDDQHWHGGPLAHQQRGHAEGQSQLYAGEARAWQSLGSLAMRDLRFRRQDLCMQDPVYSWIVSFLTL